MMNEMVLVITVIVQLFGGPEIPIVIEQVTDAENCQKELEDFDPAKMGIMGLTMSVTGECLPLTGDYFDGIINNNNDNKGVSL